jgi:hypothetical protein
MLKYSYMYCIWKVAGNSPGHFSIAVYTQHRQLLPSASTATGSPYHVEEKPLYSHSVQTLNRNTIPSLYFSPSFTKRVTLK